ncbi:type II secretion system protein [Methylobacterium sp. Leaf469]|jgi:tight adherence protein C|uniref:type II secretion system F family protein n=1 Tax=unclassified Methylobacterium TaxID=2615210 RepID=UPI0006F265E8|nr:MULTISPECIES: type II secretion system F family protein [unclassified Methylobacterium]USU30343.1 type II secretion system F family protein [Methylobacterium sp. OTU13CASTA1]KQO72946.1 type II secretion system protein [Methylobacterium sp. Leaf87]KQP30312.1 type II secretion system protein [Methylobacterium sp. Leaf102]KQP32241.1 type II secretion system protein [Methylobacterium sp. Leaf100]KQP66022.1 type II secretion system protein [Methylobacterium sp. Leaf112]
MLDVLAHKLIDPRFLGMALAGIAAAATAFALLQPLIEPDRLGKRMKMVGEERDELRQRERERLSNTAAKATLRVAPKAYMKRVVEQFNLSRWLGTETARQQLLMAGYRSPGAETGFLFFRMVTPIAMLVASILYLFVLNVIDQPVAIRAMMVIAAVLLGIKMPELYLHNATKKRQTEIRKAWPDALDLSLICVESGMSVEHAFRRVSTEIATQSIVLAEELAVMTAELSFLPDRRQAFENLANRTGLDPVKAVTTALIQAERYGTPVGQALRVLSQESRDTRMNEAEKKAAALPPKLTVPMILFFLPVLFVVILTPAMIQVFK